MDVDLNVLRKFVTSLHKYLSRSLYLYNDLHTEDDLSIDLHKLVITNSYTNHKIPPQVILNDVKVYV